jgi:predicted ATPase
LVDDALRGAPPFWGKVTPRYGTLPEFDVNIINNQPPKITILVKLKDENELIPIKSMGDGVFRALQIALTSFQSANGFFLIDEFENGLHYTVQEQIWDFIFKIAKQYNIQVFATTHSNDTVRSFLKVALDYQDLDGVAFRMGRSLRASDHGKIVATVFDEDSLTMYENMGVDIR